MSTHKPQVTQVTHGNSIHIVWGVDDLVNYQALYRDQDQFYIDLATWVDGIAHIALGDHFDQVHVDCCSLTIFSSAPITAELASAISAEVQVALNSI